MNVFTSQQALKKWLIIEQSGKSIGFAPTMGALHAGHLSLLKMAKSHCDISICSIFVNPTQFNNANDLAKYPRMLEHDLDLLRTVDCDAVYAPEPDDIYGQLPNPDPHFDLGFLEDVLEGNFRPGHYQGVISIVRRLFDIVKPHHVFFGAKDYQQCMVVNTLIQKEFPNIVFHACPIVREPDGLAMSSRNLLLNSKEREIAAHIGSTMLNATQLLKGKTSSEINHWVQDKLLEKQEIELEYVAVKDAQTFSNPSESNPKRPLVVLIAAYVGGVRLIDNAVIE